MWPSLHIKPYLTPLRGAFLQLVLHVHLHELQLAEDGFGNPCIPPRIPPEAGVGGELQHKVDVRVAIVHLQDSPTHARCKAFLRHGRIVEVAEDPRPSANTHVTRLRARLETIAISVKLIEQIAPDD